MWTFTKEKKTLYFFLIYNEWDAAWERGEHARKWAIF